jgi:AraC-like DNA-binding protein
MFFLPVIGIILAAIGILLIVVLKTPVRTSDKLLIAILTCFVVKFLLDEGSIITGNATYSAIAAVFGVSTIVSCGWYIKYLTNTGEKFGSRQMIIYLPLLALLATVVILFPFHTPAVLQSWYFRLALWIMTVLVVYYFYFCIRMLQKHKQLIRQNYSGVPGSITINWMVVIISLQIAEFLLKGVIGRFLVNPGAEVPIVTNEFCFIIETFLLVVLGIWQKSIPVFIAPVEDQTISALPPDDVARYLQRIERFMDEQKPYLDPELTIEKLSDLTRIRKLSLSQTLNKGLNKNFFTFIKEYRIRHVEAELKSKAPVKRTIMDIAYSSGFNSKTGFNRAFKEVTGKTPTEYLEEV